MSDKDMRAIELSGRRLKERARLVGCEFSHTERALCL
jgi:hypothetical protein